jgi:hypothetical protein
MINSIFGSQIIFKVKSGFLQEEDVKIVSKQIKDRIGQYRSRGNVVESQSKTSEVTQESQQQQHICNKEYLFLGDYLTVVCRLNHMETVHLFDGVFLMEFLMNVAD